MLSHENLEDLDRNIAALLTPIHGSRSVNRAAYERVERCANEVAYMLKSEPLLPKKMLRSLRAAMKTLRAEAPYIDNQKDAVDMANKLEMIFDLILLGETLEDRVAGKPRVI